MRDSVVDRILWGIMVFVLYFGIILWVPWAIFNIALVVLVVVHGLALAKCFAA